MTVVNPQVRTFLEALSHSTSEELILNQEWDSDDIIRWIDQTAKRAQELLAETSVLDHMKQRLTAFLDEGISYGLHKYEIERGWEGVRLERVTADEVSDFLSERGWNSDPYDIESNGWQLNFWQKFEHPDQKKKLILSGGGWYGGIKVDYDDEDDDES